MPNGRTGEAKLKFKVCGATLGEAGAIVDDGGYAHAGFGTCGGAGVGAGAAVL